MDLLRICEDLENLDGLHVIYKIVRGISQYFFIPLKYVLICIHSHTLLLNFSDFYVRLHAVLLNSPQIFERIFGDELIMDIIGSLECKLLSSLFQQCSINDS